jgi:hypothetical protein
VDLVTPHQKLATIGHKDAENKASVKAMAPRLNCLRLEREVEHLTRLLE